MQHEITVFITSANHKLANFASVPLLQSAVIVKTALQLINI